MTIQQYKIHGSILQVRRDVISGSHKFCAEAAKMEQPRCISQRRWPRLRTALFGLSPEEEAASTLQSMAGRLIYKIGVAISCRGG